MVIQFIIIYVIIKCYQFVTYFEKVTNCYQFVLPNVTNSENVTNSNFDVLPIVTNCVTNLSQIVTNFDMLPIVLPICHKLSQILEFYRKGYFWVEIDVSISRSSEGFEWFYKISFELRQVPHATDPMSTAVVLSERTFIGARMRSGPKSRITTFVALM